MKIIQKALMVLLACGIFMGVPATGAQAADPFVIDVFDWQSPGYDKIKAINAIQNALIQKGILKQRYQAAALVAAVDRQLAIDAEQALIYSEVCTALKLDCSSAEQ